MTTPSSDSHIAELIRTFSSESSSERKAAREKLAAIGRPATSELTMALGDPSRQVRWEAAKTLAAIGDPAAAPRLVEALSDESVDVRWTAGEALAALRREALLPLLKGLIITTDLAWMGEGALHVCDALAKDNQLRPILAPVSAALRERSTSEGQMAVPVAARKALDECKTLGAG